MSDNHLGKIHNEDCLTGMQNIPDGSVDLIFADPPFNIGYIYDQYNDSRDSIDYLDWSRDWMLAAAQALKDSGTFWLAIGDEYAAELKVMMTNDIGLTCRSWVIWYYTFGVNCTNKFSRSHTHLLYFVKDPRDFTFEVDDPAVRVPSARQLVYGDKRANPAGRLPDDTWITPPALHDHNGWVLRPQDIPTGFQSTEDTWYFPRVNGTFKERKGWHGCQMPERLLGRIISACSRPGEIVLDPFVGSGTTPTVAKKLGRRFVGFEISEQYATQATDRVDAAQVGHSLDGVSDPLTSVPKSGSKG